MVLPTMISHDDKLERELPPNPTVTQEEEEEGETKEDTADSSLVRPPKKRRRSLRNTNVSNCRNTLMIHIMAISNSFQLTFCALSFLQADRLVRSQFAPVSSLE